ncbi:hypothetical protein [Cognatishimia sp. F0-27]|uniref:hypothetical protein n=1 Tax=Cognatishimia sp. F0-27 TaxID=2816855 RepID=UPI001D0CAAF5|nr:hypothetical protein [Cognatishimia sp. F0-27]MCC1491709.1 hypothetical protein [Cognatishimia sp. F0-27]
MARRQKSDELRILAEIKPSPPRRFLGVGTLVVLGVMLLYVSIVAPPQGVQWQLFLLACGVSALVLAQAMWRATQRKLVLSEGPDGVVLADSAGDVLVHADNIARVERGVFAMKPSNGFTIKLETPGTRVWRPGLWWRFGRRLAVGGVTSGAQTRPVADILQLKVAQRKPS